MSTTPFVKFKQDLGDNKFALNTAGYGMTETGIWLPIKVTDEGDLKVQQSGTVPSQIIHERGPSGQGFSWVGENWGASSTARPLNVSAYREVVVVFVNNTDMEHSIMAIEIYNVSGERRSDYPSIWIEPVDQKVPSGAIYSLRPNQYPVLKEPNIGLLVRTSTSTESGTMIAKFIGR